MTSTMHAITTRTTERHPAASRHAALRTLPTATVFSRADARACGWSDAALSRAINSGKLLRLRRDQFTALRTDPRIAAIAAARSCMGSVISHRSAAALHGLPLLNEPPDRPDLTVQPGRTGDVQGALLHRAGLRSQDIVEIDGQPVTSLARTVVDLARTLPPAAAVVTADAALQRDPESAVQIAEVCRMCRRWPRIARARKALALADGRSESPLESYSRLVILRLALPRPELQALIRSPQGWPLGRGDFYWDEFGVIGEADGRSKYDDRPVLTAEKDRQERLEDPGVVVTRWGWRHVRQPALLEAKLRSAFERGGLRDESGFPRRWSVQPMPARTLPRW